MPNQPPFIFDSELLRFRDAVMRAMMSLHREEEEEAEMYLWGRWYTLRVQNKTLTITKKPRPVE